MVVLFEDTKQVNNRTYYETWTYFGFIGFNKGFTYRWFNYTGAVLHLLGFRFLYDMKTESALEEVYPNCTDEYMKKILAPLTRREFFGYAAVVALAILATIVYLITLFV